METYIGITIGPITDTLSLSSSPAGLWGASYLFSFLAHEIRAGLGLLSDDLTVTDDQGRVHTIGELFSKGVGLYHDRIIYQGDDLEKAGEAIRAAVDMIATHFAQDLNADPSEVHAFFESYFSIRAVRVEVKENPLIEVNQALDSLELARNFPAKLDTNYILRLFENRGDDSGKKNAAIKQSFLASGGKTEGNPDWILFGRDGQIKDLPHIASGGMKVEHKYQQYYAVIRADGDSMGRAISDHFRSEAEMTDFSNRCLRYGAKAASCVERHGGLAIYAGGDDLLCIAPVMTEEKIDGMAGVYTFLDLIREITEIFDREFKGVGPTLSFGVQIQYYKAPLYEALSQTLRLLFGVAKKEENRPNALAINLTKHSGQSAQLVFKTFSKNNSSGESALDLINDLMKKHADEDKVLQSIHSKVGQFAALFHKTISISDQNRAVIANFFDNTFDNGVSAEDRVYLKELEHLAGNMECISLPDASEEGYYYAELFGNILRLIKFFGEGKETA